MKTNAFFQLFVAVVCVMCVGCTGKRKAQPVDVLAKEDSSSSTESGSNG